MSTNPRTTAGTLDGDGSSAAWRAGVVAASVRGETVTRQPGAVRPPLDGGGDAADARPAAAAASRRAAARRMLG